MCMCDRERVREGVEGEEMRREGREVEGREEGY